jgi:HNH endonuclease
MPSPWNRGLRAPLAARLWDKIDVGSGDPAQCWEFTGNWRSKFGYGRIRDENGNCVQAHVAMYELYGGEIPDGLWLLHECDNPACCNPSHMHPGTAAENRWDQFQHGAYAGEAD